METQTNFDANQAIKNLTQAGIDGEQAAAFVSTFGNFSSNIATKDDLEVVKQELTQEINAMEARQSRKGDFGEKSLILEIAEIVCVGTAIGASGAVVGMVLYFALKGLLS